jgi:hypothetical protein
MILVIASINLIYISSSVSAQQQPNSNNENNNNNIQNEGEIPKPIVHVTIEGTVNDDKIRGTYHYLCQDFEYFV